MIRKPRSLTTLALGAALWAQAARAAEFVIFLHESANEIALRGDTGPAGKAYWEEYSQFAGQLAKSGAMRDGAALQSSGSKGALRLGGYFKIEAADLAAAKALARQAPTVRRGGSVEVFATAINPSMAPSITRK